MTWIILIIAGIMEIVWAVGMKHSDGFTKLLPSVWTILAMAISVWLLSVAMKSLPLGLAYAVWTGIGAAGTAVVGMLFLGEPREFSRILCIMLIVAGIVGLKLFARP
ncbi:Quaternary ammonium compound-resistance protein SugE [Limihaloglobus sulfuriphilus]|jgi:quaternary ammonium compound-resistance protein SugE|uniref:Guanidinium exporter n=1 Tax=Limihaloglobus sulfuriphilus TaxID=1851148 RepID=A0A1R7T652_9BACT|nr:quaternary ammonium compound efflux SMR transporter SugE [Limihaloglobus sulfuriphilus]AQQ72326.1 Quaternary ammonium compound-resistance protein SugE [Limihaloglobus sulfuriphilus]